MNREKLIQALSDAGFPVETITDETPDELLQAILQSAYGADPEAEQPEGEAELDMSEDEEDSVPMGEDEEEADIALGEGEGEEELDMEDVPGPEEEEEAPVAPMSDRKRKHSASPSKVTVTKHFRERDQEIMTFGEARRLAVKVFKNLSKKQAVGLRRAEQISAFCEEMVRQGRVLPAMKRAVKGSLLDAAASGKVKKFGEKVKTALQARMDEIKRWPVLLRLSEQVEQPEGAAGKVSEARRAELLGMTHAGQEALRITRK